VLEFDGLSHRDRQRSPKRYMKHYSPLLSGQAPGRHDVRNEALLILCLGLLAVPQTTLGWPSAAGQGESKDDLSGTWLVTVHFTRSDGGALLPYTQTHTYKGPITFIPAAKGHYSVAGNMNLAPKTDQERIYNVYFESCARLEGHDIAQTSPQTYTCSYEYGAAGRDQDGNEITTLFNGELTFRLERGILRGKSKFVIHYTNSGETHSEEAVWTGERQADFRDCLKAQTTVDLLRSRVEADQKRIEGLDSGVTAEDLNSFLTTTDEERHHILIQRLKVAVGTLAQGILSTPENALKPMDIAEYHLPNGIGSLKSGQAKAIISRLRSHGVDSPAIFKAVQNLSRVSGKEGTLEFTSVLSEIVSNLKRTEEMDSSEDSVENTAALFQLAADLAGQGRAAVVMGSALFQGAKNEFLAYMTVSAVLAGASESQLEALKVYGNELEKDLQALEQGEGQLGACGKHIDPVHGNSQSGTQSAHRRAADRCLSWS